MAARKKIVIIGGGFAGLQMARKITDKYEVTVIDKFNYHQFQPLFYQVASARLEPSSISFPLRKVFQKKNNVHFRLAHVERLDAENNLVITKNESFHYDYLVIATGCSSNFFGNNEIEKHAMPMKTTTEAMALRNKILLNFEEVLLSDNINDFAHLLNIVIVGGGPTGVEMAGALAEMKKNILPKDYPHIDFSSLNIYLLEGSGATLGVMSKNAQEKSLEYLQEMGVKVKLNALLESYDGKTARLKDGTTIETSNLIWAAGVKGNLLEGINAEIIQRGNRLKVNRYNRVEGYENIFAIGDIASMETPKYPKGHPQLANVAINQGKLLAKNLNQSEEETNWKKFEYTDMGSMATVGKRKAVVDLPNFKFSGRLAWFFWMFLHLMLILSVKNKLSIFLNWAISYFTNDTTLRLILLPSRKQLELSETIKEKYNLGAE
ncbi:MAG: NAD(P)/FAD-dependent oxidoreductase [Chitinophagaceae bacterium]|nr:MAG: NAD(P)/FAD-dependent oxidoreductase [Chitinophagaceae bacterium]